MPTADAYARTSPFPSRHKQQLETTLERPGSSSDPPPSLVQHLQCTSPSQWDQIDPLQISHTRRRTPFAVYCSQGPAGQPRPSPIHPDIRFVVQLTLADACKIYFWGSLIKRVERCPRKDDGLVDVWAQLGGMTLSIWGHA